MPNTTTDGRAILRDASARYRTSSREESGARGAFDAETKRSGGAPRVEVAIRRDSAPADVAQLLGAEAVVVRARAMYNGDTLVQLVDTFIPVDIAMLVPAVEQADTGVGGIISRFAEAGLAQTEVTEDVTLVEASAEQAAALGVEPGSKLLQILHVGRTEKGTTVEVTRHILSAGWTLRYSVPVA
ncbi:UTRA domain-containing protein [Kitasatospora sp. NPDC056184]|uniref:UTRA domain-containing protein n=1 Tax=Kitasatospora sp. NPDC056184 TaxID=3345738 RepID=UPI0035E12A91